MQKMSCWHTCVFLCRHCEKCMLVCVFLCVCVCCLVCVRSIVQVYVERENINMLEDCFFSSLLLSLLSHLHYTPISPGWIKSAIKTFIHVSVKDMRHINSTHTMSSFLSRGGFSIIHICSACFFVVYIFWCACLCFYTCICVFVYVKGAAAGKTREMCQLQHRRQLIFRCLANDWKWFLLTL